MSERRQTSAALAWSVESSLDHGGMKAALDAAFAHPWQWGEGRYHGTYLCNGLTPEAGCRIYVVGERFNVELRFYSVDGDADAQLAAARERIEKEVLPAIQARDVHMGDLVS